jgi:hypothetical protein
MSDLARQPASSITKLSPTEAAAAERMLAALSPLPPNDRRLALAFIATRFGFEVSFQSRAGFGVSFQSRAFNQIWSSGWAAPARDIPTFTSHTEVSMPVSQSERPWTKYELEAVKSLREIEGLTSLDRDTLVRVYPEYLVQLSPKRLGMKFCNVLKIMNGDAAASVRRSAPIPLR